MFDTKYSGRARKMVSHVGEPVKKEFVGHYDYNGNVELVETGVRNLYDEIQSYADECSMDSILRRFAAGDVSVLSKSQGVILLPDGAQLGGRRCKVLLIIGTKLPHCLTHIVRLIPAEARLAHTALLYVVVDVNFGHW